MNEMSMYIGGKWKRAAGRPMREVLNPATEETVALVPDGGASEVNDAVEAARSAGKQWARKTSLERASYVKEAARRLMDNKQALAHTIVAEQGKPIAEALGEVDGAAFMLNYAAEWALRLEGDVLPSDRPDEHILILKVPHGVVAGITPWNYPLAVPARKIAPALVTGNTVILKPHESTPLSALELARLFEQAGLPDGVLNVVTGTGEDVGADLVGHPGVQFVTMTGSMRAGGSIYTAAARNFTGVSLELGGKAPFIVLDDADVDFAVEQAVASRIANCGQVCICNERTYVHERIYDAFAAKLAAALAKVRIGDPLRADTQLGPKANRLELQKVDLMVRRAVEQGAEVVTGGTPLTDGAFSRGYWFAPTLLANVRQEMEIMQEEVFGPVIPLMKIRDLEEAVAYANDSKYGLSAYLFTNDYRKAMQAVRDIDFGEIFVNRTGAEAFHAYHSGTRHSGVGGDDGKYGLEAYMKKKTVYLNYAY